MPGTEGVPQPPFEGEFDPSFAQHQEIQQGDIIELLPPQTPTDGSEWTSHLGAVVTANCDLVYGKHAGILSYVPVVPIHVYLRLLMFPRIIESQLKNANAELSESLPTDAGWPTHERILELIDQERTVEVEAILDGIDQHGSLLNRVNVLEACMRMRQRYNPDADFESTLSDLDQFLQELRRISDRPQQPRGQLLGKELKNRILKQVPDDCLLLSRPVPRSSEGYIAYLRLIREIHHGTIAVSAIHERRLGNQILARRVSRLSLVYIHRLTQQMTKVFADIGLPESYEAYRDDTVINQITTWTGSLSDAAAQGTS